MVSEYFLHVTYYWCDTVHVCLTDLTGFSCLNSHALRKSWALSWWSVKTTMAFPFCTSSTSSIYFLLFLQSISSWSYFFSVCVCAQMEYSQQVKWQIKWIICKFVNSIISFSYLYYNLFNFSNICSACVCEWECER